MSLLEMAENLEAKARNKFDNARAELLVAAAFKEEYMAGISGPESKNRTAEENHRLHERSLEIYDFYIGGQRRAKEYESDGFLFRNSAAQLRNLAAKQEAKS